MLLYYRLNNKQVNLMFKRCAHTRQTCKKLKLSNHTRSGITMHDIMLNKEYVLLIFFQSEEILIQLKILF